MAAERIAFSLGRQRDAPIPDQRRHAREACAIEAYLFDAAGITRAATILDRSEAGVRVHCPEARFHLEARYILRLDTGAVYTLRRTWYAGDVGGYEFTRRVDGARPRGDRALLAIAAAWRKHQDAQAHI